MDKNRTIFPLRLSSETSTMVRTMYEMDNCSSQTEFIEKAINFYVGYLTTDKGTNFLHPMLMQSIRGTLKENEHRQSANLFRLTVEMSMMMHILAAGLEISDEELRKLRGRCVELVKKNKGMIRMDDTIHNQGAD